MFPLLRSKVATRAWLILALLPATVFQAQNAPYGGVAEIGDIAAQEQNGQVQITLSVSGTVPRPRVSRLSDPERLVFNFAGMMPKTGYSRTVVNKGAVTSVRTSLFRADEEGRPVCRVVLDLTRRASYQMSSTPGKFTISIGDVGSIPAPAAVAAAPAPVRAPAAAVSQTPSFAKTLNDISVSQADGKTTISLKFNQGENPRTMYLEAPPRFVLDFPGVGFGAEWMKPPTLRVNSPAVTAVRSSLFREQPPVVRVVFDQAEGSQAPKLLVQGNTVMVEFSDQVSVSARSKERPVPAHRVLRAARQEPETVAPPTHRSSDALPNPSAVPNALSIPPEAVTSVAVSPASVVYQDGLLLVNAENAMLVDVLYAIGEKTGAAIEVPMSDAMLDRVAVKIGPRKPREVISTMLEGSGFNYFIIEDSAGALQKVILTPKEPPAGGR